MLRLFLLTDLCLKLIQQLFKRYSVHLEQIRQTYRSTFIDLFFIIKPLFLIVKNFLGVKFSLTILISYRIIK